MRRLILLLLPALAAVSCARSAPVEPLVTVPLDSAFSLPAGHEAAIEGTPLRLRFENVVEDSRCPVDVACVWAGDARVQLRLAHPDGTEALELHTTLEPRSAVAHGYRITLERLEPEPGSETRIPREAYAAELRVEHLP